MADGAKEAARWAGENGAADGVPPSPDEEVRLGLLGDFIGFHLRLAQEASSQVLSQRFAACEYMRGFKPGHFTLLALIGDNPGITQTALSRASGRDKSSLTALLDEFTRHDLIARERIESDRRSYALSLTAQGWAALDETEAYALAHEAELDRIVGPENKAAFIALLRRVKTALG